MDRSHLVLKIEAYPRIVNENSYPIISGNFVETTLGGATSYSPEPAKSAILKLIEQSRLEE
jgi:hypothetical protein